MRKFPKKGRRKELRRKEVELNLDTSCGDFCFDLEISFWEIESLGRRSFSVRGVGVGFWQYDDEMSRGFLMLAGCSVEFGSPYC